MGHTGSLSGKRSTRSMWIGEQTLELTCKQSAGGARLSCAAACLLQMNRFCTLPKNAVWPCAHAG